MNAIKNEDNAMLLEFIELAKKIIIILKRFWWLVVVFALIIGTLLPVVSKINYTPLYRAYCSFSVKIKNNSNTSDLNSLYGIYYDKDLATQLEDTFTYIVSSDLLTDAVKEDLGAMVAADQITAECIPGSNLFELNTYADTPQEAGELLNTVVSIFEETARYVFGELEIDLVEEMVIVR